MVRWLAPMFLLGVVLGACAGGDKIAGAWKGHPLDDLILDWGPPAAYYVTSDGRQTATFSHSRFIAANQYYCNATFGTDAEGVIVTAQVDGNLGGCNRFFSDKRAP